LVVPGSGADLSYDLHMIDVERNISTKFTSDLANESSPLWTADGQSVVFSSNRKKVLDLYVKSAGGATPERVLYESADDKHAVDISADGNLLLFTEGTAAARRLWVLPMTGDQKPYRLFPESNISEGSARFSPDGRWIAYVESTGPQASHVFVQPFPATGYREQISATFGTAPSWTVDGRQIVFVGPEYTLMSADVAPAGATLKVAAPKPIFSQRAAAGASGFIMNGRGDRFLLVVSESSAQSADEPGTPVSVTVNWLTLLKGR
jgi:TolB protein